MTELSATQGAIESSRIFRTILDAMAKPGHPLALLPSPAPAPLTGTAGALIQTLCDFQSPIWLGEGLATTDITRFIKFHTGAPVTMDQASASFAVVQAKSAMPALTSFAQGSHEYPDRSTTLIVQIANFSTDDVVLSGPGLKQPVNFGAANLGAEFWPQMMTNHQHYPLGVDVIFVSAQAIACCPRSTRILLKEQV